MDIDTVMHRVILFFLAGLSVTLSLAGCGGSDRMSQLKKMAAAKKLADSSNAHHDLDPKSVDKPEKAAVANAKDPVQTKKNKSVESKPTTGRPIRSEIRSVRQEKPGQTSIQIEDSDFEEFKKKLLDKYSEKEKSLTKVKKYEAVALAFSEYVRHRRGFPPKAFPYRKPTLSWRVAILPYLGYEELYVKFDTAIRYNSPLNRRLIELMPPEFKTLAHETKTTLVAPVTSFGVYWRDAPTMMNRIEDGISDTIGIVDVIEENAVTWTQPIDYQLDSAQLSHGLKSARGFFVVIFGDGRVDKISNKVPTKHLMAMLSYDRGDSYPPSAVSALEEEDFTE